MKQTPEQWAKAHDDRARLEAAAPVLLEALKAVLVQFGPYKDGQGAAKFHVINMANRAIEMAEGR